MNVAIESSFQKHPKLIHAWPEINAFRPICMEITASDVSTFVSNGRKLKESEKLMNGDVCAAVDEEVQLSLAECANIPVTGGWQGVQWPCYFILSHQCSRILKAAFYERVHSVIMKTRYHLFYKADTCTCCLI